MVSPDWWATYQFTNGQWLLQGWEIANGTVSKIAETQVNLWQGNYSNPNWQLVEHPDGGVALVGLRGARYNTSDVIGMSHYGVRNGQFVLIDTFEIPLQSPGWDLMYCSKDYVYFVSQSAPSQSSDTPWEIRSLRDLSLVTSGPGLSSVVAPGQLVDKFPYAVSGNTFWFGARPGFTSEHLMGLKVLASGATVAVTPQGQDHVVASGMSGTDPYINSRLPHFARRDRWAVFKQTGIGYATEQFFYELSLLDGDGNAVFVQFPVLDSTFYSQNQNGDIPTGIIVLQVFFDPPAPNGSQVAHWFGMQNRRPDPQSYYEPHRFSGSFTIPNLVNSSAVITTTWQDLGIYGAPDPDYPGAYLPAVAGWDNRGMTTSSPVMILDSQDDALDGYNYGLHAWYQMDPAGVTTRLETVDLGNYNSGWGGSGISTMSPAVFAPIPTILPGLTAELRDMGQRFD